MASALQILDRPGIYLAASMIGGLASVWYVHRETGTLDGGILAAALQHFPLASAGVLNFILALILLLYYGLNKLFFGVNPTPGEHALIVDKLCNFFLFKIVLIGLVLEPDMVDTGMWTVWCATLAGVKAILQFGMIRLEAFEISEQPNSMPGFRRTLLHLFFVAAYMIGGVFLWQAIINGAHAPLALWLLVLFDLVTTLIDWAHSCLLYGMHAMKGSRRFSHPEDVEEFTYSVDLLTDLLTLLVTLFHFLHVYTISGISLSLVDILLLLNIRTTGIQLIKKIRDAYIFRMLRISIDQIFPSGDVKKWSHAKSDTQHQCVSCTGDATMSVDVDGNAGADARSTGATGSPLNPADEDMCSICLQDMDHGTKRLPCGHKIHSKCLRTLIFKGSKFSFQRAVTTARQTTLPLYANMPLNTTAADVLNIATSRNGVAGVQIAPPENPRAAAGTGTGTGVASGLAGANLPLPPRAPLRDGFRDNVAALFNLFFVAPPFSNAATAMEESSSRTFVAQLMQNVGCHSFKCPLCRSDIDSITGKLLVKNDSSTQQSSGSARANAQSTAASPAPPSGPVSPQGDAATATHSNTPATGGITNTTEGMRVDTSIGNTDVSTTEGPTEERSPISPTSPRPTSLSSRARSTLNRMFGRSPNGSSSSTSDSSSTSMAAGAATGVGGFFGRPAAASSTRMSMNQQADHVLEMFPFLARDAVLQDLHDTYSIERTVDNIMHSRGRFRSPHYPPTMDHSDSRSSTTATGAAGISTAGHHHQGHARHHAYDPYNDDTPTIFSRIDTPREEDNNAGYSFTSRIFRWGR